MIMAVVTSLMCEDVYIHLSPPLEAEAAENVSMTLTELSVFMKKQELELQLRTEKEKEEGEYLLKWHIIKASNRVFLCLVDFYQVICVR